MKTLSIAGLALASLSCFAEDPSPRTAAAVGTAAKLIDHFHMQKVPQEGCWFALTYSSADVLDGDTAPARYGGRNHVAGSAIVAVETPRDFSAMHRLRTDEVWHFYEGSPIDMLLLYPDGHGLHVTLGSDVLAGQLRQFTVPRDVWQGSAPRDKSASAYALFADQLSPGFDYADFEIGYRDALQREYPAFAHDIAHLTRAEFAVHPARASTRAPQPTNRRTPNAFAESAVAAQTLLPGVVLKELVGQKSSLASTPHLSVARFTLAPGRDTGTSFNHRSEEVFVIESGQGRVHLQTEIKSVGPGSTVFIPATVPHSIESDPGTELVFLAISAPAFTPEDYVPVKP